MVVSIPAGASVIKGDLLYLSENGRVHPLNLFILKPAIGIAGNSGEVCDDIAILNSGKMRASEKFVVGEYVYWSGMKWSPKPPAGDKNRVYSGGIAISPDIFLIDVTYMFTF